jgi:hypothetical protein
MALGGLVWAQTTATPSASPAISTASASSPANSQNDVESASGYISDPASLLPDLPALPNARATLIGGTIEKLDRVRDQMTVAFFGGGRMTVLFDPRTEVYLGDALASTDSLRQGEAIHFDTILDKGQIFAKSIRAGATTLPGEMQGVLLRYRPERGELTLRDAISPNPIRLRVPPSTRVTMNGQVVSATKLAPGSLVAVKFDPSSKGRDTANEISILALSGVGYTFTGRLVDLDLSSGLLVIGSSTDGKTYEVYLENPAVADNALHPGVAVTVVAAYEGSRYVAHSFKVESQRK